MSSSANHLLGTAAPAPSLTLAALVATRVVAPSQGCPQVVHLDCSALPYQHTLSVCHQVSQLLLLRRAGVEVLLYQVNPLLGRCLIELRVNHLFAWVA